MLDYEIIIVGAGPAGCATALQISHLDFELGSRVLLLDKSVFPRKKLCAGGLSADADAVLRQLGIEIDSPSIAVDEASLILPTGRLIFQQSNLFRVVRREQFDYCLFRAVLGRGVDTHDGETVEQVVCTPQHVLVQTSRNEYRAKVLIAADGAHSTVRNKLGLTKQGRLMVAMELHARAADLSIPNFTSNSAMLDLSLLAKGVPGYCWVFPAVNEDVPEVSLGILAAPTRNEEVPPLKKILKQWLTTIGLNSTNFEVQAHPIISYDPNAASSLHRVLFVGDAAGADPLFGEGISSALALGVLAAESACDSLARHDFSFSDYERRIRTSSIGYMMRRRRMIARRLYSHPKLARFFLRHGSLLRGLALLRPPVSGAKLTWEPQGAC